MSGGAVGCYMLPEELVRYWTHVMRLFFLLQIMESYTLSPKCQSTEMEWLPPQPLTPLCSKWCTWHTVMTLNVAGWRQSQEDSLQAVEGRLAVLVWSPGSEQFSTDESMNPQDDISRCFFAMGLVNSTPPWIWQMRCCNCFDQNSYIKIS